MISTEWGHPRSFAPGFNPKDVAEGNYGTHINVFDWKKGKLLQVRSSIEIRYSIEDVRHKMNFIFLHYLLIAYRSRT